MSGTTPTGGGRGKPMDVAVDDAVRATVDGDELLDRLGIDGPDIERRKRYAGFDARDAERLSALADDVDGVIDDLVTEFYEHIETDPSVRRVLERSSLQMPALRAGQQRYLQRLVAEETYGREYFADRARVGRLHDLLGLGPDAYLSQYVIYYEGLFDVLAERAVASVDAVAPTEENTGDVGATGADANDVSATDGTETSSAADAVDRFRREALSVIKAVTLDQGIAIDTYVESYSRKAEREARRQRELACDVAERIAEPVGDLAETTESVAVRGDQIDQLAGAQADRMRELARETDEMTATVEEVAATAETVAETSADASDLASDGVAAATGAADAMAEIGEATDAVRMETRRFHERIDDIRGVADVIANVAEQTNLLALNASIEAARAGESGAGFAVVADEVKSLASDTAEHAAEIESVVEELADGGVGTLESLERTADRVDDGTERVADVADRLDAIERAVEDASAGIAEVSDAMDTQATSVEGIAAAVEESATATDEMADRANGIAEATERQRDRVERIRVSAEELVAASAT